MKKNNVLAHNKYLGKLTVINCGAEQRPWYGILHHIKYFCPWIFFQTSAAVQIRVGTRKLVLLINSQGHSKWLAATEVSFSQQWAVSFKIRIILRRGGGGDIIMLNLDQITEQGASLDLQGLVILKDRKIRTPKRRDREQVRSGDGNKGAKWNERSLFWIHR